MTQAEFVADMSAANKMAHAYLRGRTFHYRDSHIVETLANDLYMKALEFDGNGDFRAYICQMARFLRNNMGRNHIRNDMNNIPEDFDTSINESESIDLSVLDSELRSYVEDRLSGMNFREMGEKRGCSRQYAESQYSEALEVLRSELVG